MAKQPTAQPAGIKVKMLCMISGAEPPVNVGDIVTVDAAEAKRLIEIGAAVEEKDA
jgi:hypothetical protein